MFYMSSSDCDLRRGWGGLVCEGRPDLAPKHWPSGALLPQMSEASEFVKRGSDLGRSPALQMNSMELELGIEY